MPRADLGARARDWSEIQERMLVPLYEAVYERLEVGPGTRLLGLGCGSGLALLMAASRGAALTGVEPFSPQRLALARERLLPGAGQAHARGDIRLTDGSPGEAADAETRAYNLVTAFEPIGCLADDAEGLLGLLAAATPLTERGAPVVLVGWGPPERCATWEVLRAVAGPDGLARTTGPGTAPRTTAPGTAPRAAGPDAGLRTTGPGASPRTTEPGTAPRGTGPGTAPRATATGAAPRTTGPGASPRTTGPGAASRATGSDGRPRGSVRLRPALRDDLEEAAQQAGLRPDGSGRVACPFGYAGVDSAVKGLLSTGLFDAALAATDQEQVGKELTEALHPYRRPDGTVWMPNVFRYLIARTP
ncbi:SAM-dependent methyltransferase [Streptomyces sp. NPDC001388]|uniref:SAM-dependent methyltransferase n=1 Tax=Streptomyces sp. NPDC001388 TaxID=3364568 RepID=UPI0036AF97B1